MKKSLPYSILLCLLFIFNTGYSQQDCDISMEDAQLAFSQGKLEKAIALLSPCANKDFFRKEQLFEVYHLLALAHQNLGEKDKMEHYIRKMLRLDPDYGDKPNNDPTDFTKEVRRFSVKPAFFMGVQAGVFATSISQSSTFTPIKHPQRYNSKAGYTASLIASAQLFQSTNISFGVGVLSASIEHQIDEGDVITKIYLERLTALRTDLGLNHTIIQRDKFSVYAGLNFGMSLIKKSQVNFTATNEIAGSKNQFTKNAIDERNTSQPSLGFVTGFEIPLAIGQVGFSISYSRYLNTTVDASKRFEDTDFIFNTQYINDDIKLSYTAFRISYVYPFRPRVFKSKK